MQGAKSGVPGGRPPAQRAERVVARRLPSYRPSVAASTATAPRMRVLGREHPLLEEGG